MNYSFKQRRSKEVEDGDDCQHPLDVLLKQTVRNYQPKEPSEHQPSQSPNTQWQQQQVHFNQPFSAISNQKRITYGKYNGLSEKTQSTFQPSNQPKRNNQPLGFQSMHSNPQARSRHGLNPPFSSTQLAFQKKQTYQDVNQTFVIRPKIVSQAFEKLQKDIDTNKDFYLKLRKEYDKTAIYENLFNRSKGQNKAFKALSFNIKKLAFNFFGSLLPNYSKKHLKQQPFGHSHKNQPLADQKPTLKDQKLQLIFEPQIQKLLEKQLVYYTEDFKINLLQISIVAILNFMEKIIETELYILEGTAIESAEKLDANAIKKHIKQSHLQIKEQKLLLKLVKYERLYLFLFWNYAESLSTAVVPQQTRKDFTYKRCINGLKKLRQMIYSMNYLLMERQRSSLYNCYSNIRSFLKETCLMLINKLSEKKGFPHKHLQLLKTLYGMADEMVNKNFMEEKKSNQKKVFVQDNPDDTNVKEGRSANFEELMNSLKEQLDDIDFLDDETSEIVEELDEELADGQVQAKPIKKWGTPQGYFEESEQSSIVSEQGKDQSIEDGEKFFKEMGYRDPFHKRLLQQEVDNDLAELGSNAFNNQENSFQNNPFGGDQQNPFNQSMQISNESAKGTQNQSQNEIYPISHRREQFPKSQLITRANLKKIDNLIENNPQFQTILANLLFSANNPFQEGLAFSNDSSYKKQYEDKMMKTYSNKSTIYQIVTNDHEDQSERKEKWDSPLDIISLVKSYEKLRPLYLEHAKNQSSSELLLTMDNINKGNQTVHQTKPVSHSRFEKLVYSEFSFDKKYGDDKVEERAWRQLLMCNGADPNFLNQQSSQAVQDGNISKGSEQSGNKMLNQIRMGMQKQYFDMMENKLNPYRRKKSNQTIISCKKTETGGSSIYWRRYSGSVEQSVKDNRSFQHQSVGSMRSRRMSVTNNLQKEYESGNFALYALSQGLSPLAAQKRRSATIHIAPRIQIGNSSQRVQDLLGQNLPLLEKQNESGTLESQLQGSNKGALNQSNQLLSGLHDLYQ